MVNQDFINDLPSALKHFAIVLNSQPEPIQTNFRYCLAMLMVKAGKARLIRRKPWENGAIYTFQTTTGDIFSLPKRQMSEQDEAMVIEALWEILKGEGLL